MQSTPSTPPCRSWEVSHTRVHEPSVTPGSMFFFSSRRRHTRFDCDWSSDVCSSDLRRARPPRPAERGPLAAASPRPGRSEERRVGKECRSRWSPSHRKKKPYHTLDPEPRVTPGSMTADGEIRTWDPQELP